MKVFISTFGDPSVGIFGSSIMVDLVGWKFENKKDREDTRGKLINLFDEFLDEGEKPTVIFEDENGW